MKARMNDGTIIECTPKEYAELQREMRGPIPDDVIGDFEDDDVDVEEAVPYIKIDAFEKQRESIPIKRTVWHKWTDEERDYIVANRSKTMQQLANDLDGKYTPTAILTQLYELAKKRGFDRSSIGKVLKKEDTKSRRWTKEETRKLIEKYKQGVPYGRIMRSIPGRTKKALEAKIKDMKSNGEFDGHQVKVIPGKHGDEWSADEEDKLIKLYQSGKNIYDIAASDFPDRTRWAIDAKLKKLRDTGRMKKRRSWKRSEIENTIKEKLSEEKDDNYIEKRRKFLDHRAKVLVKQYGWSYEKARIYATNEYEGKKTKKFVVPEKFPEFSMVSKSSLHIVEEMVRQMIGNKGKIEFRDMFSIVTDSGDNFWEAHKWQQFMAEFLANSDTIAAYFGAENKFNIQKNARGYDIIKYGY